MLISLPCLAVSGLAAAQTPYPSRVISVQIPFPPGTGNDLLGRALANKLPSYLRQSVVVENRAGASGYIATEYVRRSAPDGHTLVLTSVSFSIVPNTTTLKYTPEDFTAVAMLGTLPFILIVNKSLPVSSMKDLIDYVKERPGKLSIGQGGPTGTTYFLVESLKKISGIDVVSVPYKGTTDAMRDLLAGHIHLMFAPLSTGLTYHRTNEVKLLGITGSERTALLPELATFTQQGYPALDISTWFALLGPAGMSPNAVQVLSEALEKTLATEQVIQTLNSLGIIPDYQGPTALASFLQEDARRWNAMVKESGFNSK